MDTSNTTKGDLEVMGISRSGRVRKKSSKLMDFQSPDEIEPRSKKAHATKQPLHAPQKQAPIQLKVASPTFDRTESPCGNINKSETLSESDKSDDDIMSENDDSMDSNGESDDMKDISGMENDPNDENFIDPTVRQSLYMSEATKRKELKEGKIVYTKAHRKDKGISRFTAYQLWAKDARKIVINQNPGLDFVAISRRLGEMWANVPACQKYNWKRRAKRYNNKRTKMSEQQETKGGVKLLNRIMGSSKKSASSVSEQGQHTDSSDIHSSGHGTSNKTSPSAPSGGYKVTGMDFLDVAAHLTLLGDSLTIIGQRLKEHEGQITVSGSVSVLLDSLLCSLSPLMCLTTQIPGFENKPDLKECLQNTLDNIAYVMPGL